MRSIDPSNERRSARRHRWWLLTGRGEEPAEPPAVRPDEEASEGATEEQVPLEWVDNQTAHRVNR